MPELSLPTADYQPDANVPLVGIRVLDLSRLVSGNMVTHQLADFGAEVIKVERPGVGDDLRNWRVNGVEVHFKHYCRNKRSITLDLRHNEGRDLLLQLVRTAHVIVENFRPGTMERWGLGPDELHAVNPSLIITRVSGWGQTSSKAGDPGYGSLIEARSGFAAMNGFADREPVLPPLALADMVAGLQGAFAVMVALREIETNGGDGQTVDLSLFEPLHSILGPNAAIYQLTGREPRRTGNRSDTTAPRNAYRTLDGKYVALSASMQSMAERLLKAIGREELIDDPRFRTNADRVANNDELDPIVAEFMASRTQKDLVEYFTQQEVTVGPISSIADIVEDNYVREREVLASYPDEDMGSMPMPAPAVRLSQTPGAIRTPAPTLGQHTDEMLMDLGVSPENLRSLRDRGVI
ncbi:MAG: CoA transferase [Chromatiales bacterium]|jgi:crotonobetainyl-CoA:carnitine CoA-transferase CaiB-like acyl-CoA transferase|nr:CoA transferase [Chromatiales bacterium]